MQALQFAQTGNLDYLNLRDLPTPTPTPGEVLVQVKAAGINPSDIKNVLGRFAYTTLPRIPGRDFAGIVVEGPAEWQGLAVWGSGKGIGFTRDGSHAEYVALPIAALSKKPASLSFAQAAACGVPYITALEALDRSQVQRGTPTLIIGGGAVAQAARHLAQARQAHIVMAVRQTEQCQALKAAGIKSILLTDEHELPKQVQEYFAEGAEVIFDTSGYWLGAVTALANYGRMAVISTPSAAPLSFAALEFYRRGATLIGVNSLLHELPTSAQWLDQLAQQFDSGKLSAPTAPREWTLLDGVSLYRQLAAGDTHKTVFVF